MLLDFLKHSWHHYSLFVVSFLLKLYFLSPLNSAFKMFLSLSYCKWPPWCVSVQQLNTPAKHILYHWVTPPVLLDVCLFCFVGYTRNWTQGLMLASTLPLDPFPSSFCFFLVSQIGSCTFAWVSLRPWSSYFCLLNNWDYRSEPPCPALNVFSVCTYFFLVVQGQQVPKCIFSSFKTIPICVCSLPWLLISGL
jgi:hypothetical protein